MMMHEEQQVETSTFWQDHSLVFLEMAFRTDRHKRMENPDGYAKKTGDCGDTVEMFIKLDGDRIEKITYDLDGCVNTKATSNAVCKMVIGKRIEEAWEITPEMVAELLQTLPEDHFHCAELAVGALYLALSDCKENQRSPWKKGYKTSA